MQSEETLLAKMTTLQCKYLLSDCEEKRDIEIENNVI